MSTNSADQQVSTVLTLAGDDDNLPDEAKYLPVTEHEPAPEPVGAFLKSITVSGFRGVGPTTSLDLHPAAGLTVVAGRNGSGKSTFAEALEVALTVDVGAAEQAALVGQRLEPPGRRSERSGYWSVMQRELRDRVVLVTGGSSGIGRASAARLARDGARVVTCARDAGRLEAAVADLPGDVHGVACDLCDGGDRAALVDAVIARHGRIDALVNNAGQGRIGLLTDLDARAVEELIAINLVAVADLTRLVLPHLAAEGGDVVMLSSVAAWAPMPPLSLYSATKAGVDGLVAALRREAVPGVRVHSVNPGPVRTEWVARASGDRPGEQDGPHKLQPGVPADWVAEQVARCLTSSGPRTAAVPRVLGVARLSGVPPVGWLLDTVLAPVAPALARWARDYGRQVRERR
jgi:NAD(P)-dependent dehydrogenase (short-subunit alcohol dehydrogenase family)